MKRCWFGLGALVVILVLGILSGAYFSRICRAAGEEMARAAESAQPEEVIWQVSRRWEKHRLLASVLCDHAALESIEEHFRILDPQAENFREICLRLAAKFESLSQSQQLTWENVF